MYDLLRENDRKFTAESGKILYFSPSKLRENSGKKNSKSV
jgi:hypothetical protein